MFKKSKKSKLEGLFPAKKRQTSKKKKALGVGLASAAAVAISGAISKKRDTP